MCRRRTPAMMHDFSVTGRAIFYHLPAVLHMDDMKSSNTIRWQPSAGSRICVVPRDESAGRERWYEIPTCYIYHPLNAFDDGDAVVLDVVRYPRLPLFDPGRKSQPADQRISIGTADADAPDLQTGALRSGYCARHLRVPGRRSALRRAPSPPRLPGRSTRHDLRPRPVQRRPAHRPFDPHAAQPHPRRAATSTSRSSSPQRRCRQRRWLPAHHRLPRRLRKLGLLLLDATDIAGALSPSSPLASASRLASMGRGWGA